MRSREYARCDPSNSSEVAALVQVPGVGVGGTGQQTGTPAAVTAQVQATLAQIEANKAAAAAAAAERAAAAGNGAGGYTAFDPRGAFQVPNNFWGFAMLMMGMR